MNMGRTGRTMEFGLLVREVYEASQGTKLTVVGSDGFGNRIKFEVPRQEAKQFTIGTRLDVKVEVIDE